MHHQFRRLIAALSVLCGLSTPVVAAPEAIKAYGPATATEHLLVRGTTDIALFDAVLQEFSQANPSLGIEYEQWGSNELYDLSVSACADRAQPADLIISSAVDQQVKLVNDGCAQPHVSSETSVLPAALNWRNELFGITREPAVIVYDRNLVPAQDVPKSRFQLIDLLRADHRYAGRVATYDIEQSGLGYLFAFADSLQATTFGSLIEAFSQSEAVTTCCSADIIDGVASGKYLIAYNVGEVLKSFVTKRRDKKAALKFLKKTMRRHGPAGEIVTDRLRSYGAALRELGICEKQETARWANNRAENSHPPFPRRKRAMLRFRRVQTLQKFASIHASVFNHFNQERSLSSSANIKLNRDAALAEWRGLFAA